MLRTTSLLLRTSSSRIPYDLTTFRGPAFTLSTLHFRVCRNSVNNVPRRSFTDRSDRTEANTLVPGDNTTPIIRTTRMIRTLDPGKLTPDDYVDLSLRHSYIMRTAPRSADGVPRYSGPHACGFKLRPAAWAAYGGFPPNTRGFLYYVVPPHSPPLQERSAFASPLLRTPPASTPAPTCSPTAGTRGGYPCSN